MAQVGEINVKIGADTKDLDRGVKSAKTSLNSLGSSAKTTGSAVNEFGNKSKIASKQLSSMGSNAALAVKAVAGLAVAMGAFNISRGIYETSASFESLEAQLKVSTGSAEKAQQAFDALNTLATTMPESVEDVTSAFIKMKNLGLEPTSSSLLAFSNVAASQSKTIMQFVEAVADAATGEFERLKEFGIKSSVEGEKVAFTFKGLTTTIANDSASISKYLQGIGENDFAGAAAAQMETLNGISSNLSVSINNLYNTMGETGGSDIARDAMGTLTTIFTSLEAAIRSANQESGNTGNTFSGLATVFNAIAPEINDLGNAFSGIAEKVGLLYAILATEINMETFDNIGSYIDDYNVNMTALAENSRLFRESIESPLDTSGLEEAATTLDAIAVSGGGKKGSVDNSDFMDSLLEKAIADDEFMQGRFDATKAFREAQFAIEEEFNAKTAEDRLRTFGNLETLEEQYASESELLVAKYEEQQFIIDEALLNEQLSAEEHESLMSDIAKKGSDARTKLSELEGRKKLQFTSEILGNVSSLMSSKNKEMFEIGKVAATANAVVNTYQGATKALAEVPYPFNFAAAASVVVAGMAQVSAIQSTSFGGATAAASTIGAPAVDSGAVGATSAPVGGTLTVEGLSASSLFTGDAVAAMAAELLDYQRQGGNVILQG